MDEEVKLETSWHSYPSIYAMGHKAIADLLTVPVIVEEKIDGSQFSFGVFGGVLKCRSKGQEIVTDAPEKMFALAVETAMGLVPLLHDGWTYRAEYLAKPKHNSLAYERVPKGYLIVFDINTGHEAYMRHGDKANECDRIGLECVNCFHSGMIDTAEQFKNLLDTDSILGGQKIEGVVVKPREYHLYGRDKKVLMGKYVSEHFKEVHAKEWKASNPGREDVLQGIIESYRTEARFQKAVQHLRDAGKLENDPRDIGALMKEVHADIAKECREEIGERLLKWAMPQIIRQSTHGLPEWYKTQLLQSQFEAPAAAKGGG